MKGTVIKAVAALGATGIARSGEAGEAEAVGEEENTDGVSAGSLEPQNATKRLSLRRWPTIAPGAYRT